MYFRILDFNNKHIIF